MSESAEIIPITKSKHIRRGSAVRVSFEGRMLNPVYERERLIGYRVTTGNGFWAIVPVESVTVVEE